MLHFHISLLLGPSMSFPPVTVDKLVQTPNQVLLLTSTCAMDPILCGLSRTSPSENTPCVRVLQKTRTNRIYVCMWKEIYFKDLDFPIVGNWQGQKWPGWSASWRHREELMSKPKFEGSWKQNSLFSGDLGPFLKAFSRLDEAHLHCGGYSAFLKVC